MSRQDKLFDVLSILRKSLENPITDLDNRHGLLADKILNFLYDSVVLHTMFSKRNIMLRQKLHRCVTIPSCWCRVNVNFHISHLQSFLSLIRVVLPFPKRPDSKQFFDNFMNISGSLALVKR